MHSFKENKFVNFVFSACASFKDHPNFYKKECGAYTEGQFGSTTHVIHTPLSVIKEMVESVFSETIPDNNSKFLVFFNVEIVFSLVYNFGIEFKNISFFSDHASKTKLVNSLSDKSVEVIIEKEKLMSKKFDFVFGNPPYNGNEALHQQVFNKAVNLVNDAGYVVFVQPATPYQHKKSKKNRHDKEMLDNAIKYRSKVRFHPGTVFEAAAVGTDVAITTLQKTKSIPVINEVTYKDGKKYEKVNPEHISITEFHPEIYSSVVGKFKAICKANGSVGNNTTKNKQVDSAFLSKVRGNIGTDDFFTIVPRKAGRKHYVGANNKGFGVVIPKEHVENFYDYCESFVARIGLALIKINVKMECGELNLVPMFDFSRTYTDEELYSMVGLTQEEIDAIEAFLPDYYGRKG